MCIRDRRNSSMVPPWDAITSDNRTNISCIRSCAKLSSWVTRAVEPTTSQWRITARVVSIGIPFSNCHKKASDEIVYHLRQSISRSAESQTTWTTHRFLLFSKAASNQDGGIYKTNIDKDCYCKRLMELATLIRPWKPALRWCQKSVTVFTKVSSV